MPHSANGSSPTPMSRSSSPSAEDTNTNTTAQVEADAFPKPAGISLQAPRPTEGHLSPSRSTVSFDSSPRSVQAISEQNVGFDDARHTRSASRGATNGHHPPTNSNSRQRAQFFEDRFAYKDDSTSSSRDRVTKDAPVIADLRTNVIIKDEYTLVTDLSHHLSQRYQRPESSIMITVNHSACLLLGGSFEPTYILTINALPVSIQPTLNKRNAALIQSFLFETIGVHADRGIIKFVPIAEESLATNGMTMLGEIERLERQQAAESTSLVRALTKSSKRSVITKAKSSFQLARHDSRVVESERATPPLPSPGPCDSGIAVNDKDQEITSTSNLTRKVSTKEKSSKQLKEKSSSKSTPAFNIAPPPIPVDTKSPRVGKRKSFIAIFKR
ncbi:hypothetical protein BU24DRAFT_51157 [Aaosphaeria arxii CBS 175.79]|uniref:L-dopachrome isomerase n=1 Tax=Aaosphaeria arxii CBS 175.79 TaxID=1450172 RepID=A0A6A5XDY1_9PLEO|nr:uncharacterized protein BU24DRAFT_51157 [Aaosphaeria arxii CBS 175.79]KAF2011017.1 hypothetical protein BU24DRAFT_51157 [Aaosphaeria arxii CBS 175.79]